MDNINQHEGSFSYRNYSGGGSGPSLPSVDMMESGGSEDYTCALGALRANETTYTRDKISNIIFLNDGTKPENPIASWDVSANEDGSVMAYIYTEPTDETLFRMYVVSNNKRFAMPSNSSRYFMNYSKCKQIVGLELLDTSNVTNMSNMFGGCSELVSIDIHAFDTSKVTSMSFIFNGCEKLIIIDLHGIDTSNVTTMKCMFQNCKAIRAIYLNGLNMNKVTDISYMFFFCGYIDIIDLRDADFTNVTTYTYMFNGVSHGVILYVKNEDTHQWIITNGGRSDSNTKFYIRENL